MIQLLGQGSLYQVNRNRDYYQRQRDKRKAAALTLFIFAVVSAGVIAWILQ